MFGGRYDHRRALVIRIAAIGSRHGSATTVALFRPCRIRCPKKGSIEESAGCWDKFLLELADVLYLRATWHKKPSTELILSTAYSHRHASSMKIAMPPARRLKITPRVCKWNQMPATCTTCSRNDVKMRGLCMIEWMLKADLSLVVAPINRTAETARCSAHTHSTCLHSNGGPAALCSSQSHG